MSICMKKVASYYVSREEIDRLLELYRDGEDLEVHRIAIDELKRAGAAVISGDDRKARDSAICAREVMLSWPDYFPLFKASKAYGNTAINIDGGKTANFL